MSDDIIQDSKSLQLGITFSIDMMWNNYSKSIPSSARGKLIHNVLLNNSFSDCTFMNLVFSIDVNLGMVLVELLDKTQRSFCNDSGPDFESRLN